MELAIQTRELSKRYGRHLALDRLSLEVPCGSIFAFLGSNGAGKTTTLKILAGLRHPSAGAALIQGCSVRRESFKTRSWRGYWPGGPTFYGWMTGREYLIYSAQLSNVEGERRKERVEFLLELVGLRKVREPIRAFSRGMRQRLGIAQALVHDPPVLLLDEPTSALDPLGRKELLETLASLRGGPTIFFSTHILGDAERVADRVAILQGGRLMVQEKVEDLHQRYGRRTIRLEVEGEPAELIAALRREPWALEVRREERYLSLATSDLAAAQRRIPQLLADTKLPLRRMEANEPTLEEIFMQVLEAPK